MPPKALAKRAPPIAPTHDNNTMAGWFAAEPGPNDAAEAWAAERERCRAYCLEHEAGADLIWGAVAGTWATKSRLAIAPAQDLLGLGAAERMNTPGTVEGNWRFRLQPGALTPALAQRLRALTEAQRRG